MRKSGILVHEKYLAEEKAYRQHSTVPASSAAHDGEDVVAYAQGPMAHLVNGVMEQNSLAYIMAYAACIGPARKTQVCHRRRVDTNHSPTKPADPWSGVTAHSNHPMDHPQSDQAIMLATENDVPLVSEQRVIKPPIGSATGGYQKTPDLGLCVFIAVIFLRVNFS